MLKSYRIHGVRPKNNLYFSNAHLHFSWTVVCRLLRAAISLAVGLALARTLGPRGFGIITSILTFTTLFATMATLGLPEVVISQLATDKTSAKCTLGTCAVLILFAGAIAYPLILLATAYFLPYDNDAFVFASVACMTLFFKPYEIAVYWFESQTRAHAIALQQIIVSAGFGLFKLFVLQSTAPLVYFALVVLAETGTAATLLLRKLANQGFPLTSLSASWPTARDLLKTSLPLLGSSIAIVLYMKADQIMLLVLRSPEEAGLYNAASRITDLIYMLPVAFMAAVTPGLLRMRAVDPSEYNLSMQRIYRHLAHAAVAIVLLVITCSSLLVTLLLGAEFHRAARLLSLLSFAAPFVFFGVAGSHWFIAEGRTTLALQRTTLGLFTNVCLNFMLIPPFGPEGACAATVTSYAVAGFLSDALHPATRLHFSMKTRAITAFPSIRGA